MDYVSSNYKLTFDPSGSPLVVVNYGQRIDRELEWKLAKQMEVIYPVDSTTAFFRDAQATAVTLTVTTYTDAANDLAARTAIMNAMVTVAGLTRKPLRVELSGLSGHYWQFSAAFLKTFEPARRIESSQPRYERTWEIVATGLSYT